MLKKGLIGIAINILTLATVLGTLVGSLTFFQSGDSQLGAITLAAGFIIFISLHGFANGMD